MPYNANAPADDQFLSDFPPEMREQLRAIINDEIVDALKLCGLSPGNLSGNIAVNNGSLNANLNADMLDGKEATAFSLTSHTHSAVTQSSNGFMSNTDKTKLDGVASGAEVNQNAFANVMVGSTKIQAGNKTDTFTLSAGNNISITGDATNDKATFSFSGVLPVENGGTGSSTEKYLNLSGGTLTGTIISTGEIPLKATTTYNDGSGMTYTSNVLMVNTSNTQYGNNVALGGAGNTIVGGGESYSAQLSALEGDSSENCYICADGTVYIKPNCNTFANAKIFAFTTDGKIQFPDGSTIWVE